MIHKKHLLFASLLFLLGAVFAQYGGSGYGSSGSSSSSSAFGLEGYLHVAMPLLAVALLAWILAPLVIIWKYGEKPEWAMVGVLASSSSLGAMFVLFYLVLFGMLMSSGMYGYGSPLSSMSKTLGAYSTMFMLESGLP